MMEGAWAPRYKSPRRAAIAAIYLKRLTENVLLELIHPCSGELDLYFVAVPKPVLAFSILCGLSLDTSVHVCTSIGAKGFCLRILVTPLCRVTSLDHQAYAYA